MSVNNWSTHSQMVKIPSKVKLININIMYTGCFDVMNRVFLKPFQIVGWMKWNEYILGVELTAGQKIERLIRNDIDHAFVI